MALFGRGVVVESGLRYKQDFREELDFERMPYKARLQEGQERKCKKPTYRVTNCHEYNQSLKKRGKISLYFPDGDLLSQFIDASPYTRRAKLCPLTPR
jgi:Asp-tRNA(Asn)/Glu-tRNA(Gln) amidotransferase B subunit